MTLISIEIYAMLLPVRERKNNHKTPNGTSSNQATTAQQLAAAGRQHAMRDGIAKKWHHNNGISCESIRTSILGQQQRSNTAL
jgi:hypothetical protein